jgi:light-independent protochlorophyllide reductase subunit B
VRTAAEEMGLEALITDDYLDVEEKIAELRPELVLGTQMERHIAKRLGLPCAVISAPVHVQDFPARYAPQMGFEGANVLFDSWVHPLMMGLEEHLLQMFKDDFEFREGVAPSHLGSVAGRQEERAVSPAPPPSPAGESNAGTTETQAQPRWSDDAENELKKIPFFVRRKARRNTEAFASQHGLAEITVEVLYDAKAHFSR